MKKIPLTKGAIALIDDEDYELVNKYSWYMKEADGDLKYAMSDIRNKEVGRKRFSMHRLIMDSPKELQVDHINANGLDNRKSNLRHCTQTQNNGNFRIGVRNKSGYKGVSWHKSGNKWRATLLYCGKQRYLGSFRDKVEAAKAYNEAAVKYFGEFARLNKV